MTDEALYALDKESHRMWAEQGMEAPWMHLTFEEFQEKIHHVPMFVALDAETGELLGMHSFRPHRKQLAPSILWGPTLGPLTARMSFAGSWIVNHVLKHSDGRDNFMGRIARKVLKK